MALPAFDFAPFALSGTVIGALLNDPAEIAELGDAVSAPPYKAPPREPVLQVKPRNTFAADGDAVPVPAGAPGLLVAANLGIVIGRTACRVAEADALSHVAGWTVVADLSLPVEGPQRHYRPAVRQRVRDGFCPIGPRVWPAAALALPDALAVQVWIDGALAQRSSTAGRTRGVARLLADVSAFMTLAPGDLLLLGAAAGAPLARAGQAVGIEIEGLGMLRFGLEAEA